MRPLRRPLKQQPLRTRTEPEIVRQFIRIANGEPDSDSYLDAIVRARELVEWGDVMPRRSRVKYQPGQEEFLRGHHRDRIAKAVGDLLRGIAFQNSAAMEKSAGGFSYWIYDCRELLSEFCLRMVRSHNDAAKNGEMRAVLEPREPMKTFLAEVELSRVKRCAYEACAKIFWAGRLDQPCCSDACGNAYRQKRHRDREKENRPYKKRMQLKKRGHLK
jgi:hypothetical protein